MSKKNSKAENRKIFLAKEVAQLVISKYSALPLEDVKSALMSAEEFVLQTMYYRRKDISNNPLG